MSPSDTDRPGWQEEIERLDEAVYSAVAATLTPRLDHWFRGLSKAADHSKLWIAGAAVLAAVGGRTGRRAATNGLASIAVTSSVVNLLLKPLASRRRPVDLDGVVPVARRVKMPRSTSFPSGHSASAFAFATGVAMTSPRSGLPVMGAAALVAYSRVHTGVHFPSDTVGGAVIGAGLAPAVVAGLDRRRARLRAITQYV